MSRLDELRFMTRVVQRYYVDGQRQSAIAKDLSMSQATVSRMIKRAHEEGIVRFSLTAPNGTYPELEAELRDKYGIAEAIVVDCSEDREAAIISRIGEAAAHFLETTIQNNEVIGISSWSQTIVKMIDNVHQMAQGKAKAVVQTLGGIGNPNVQKHATQVTTRLAQLTGAESIVLQPPAVAASKEARIILLGEKFVRKATDQFDNISLAFIGIGAIEPSEMLAQSGNIFSDFELTQLSEEGAIAEMSQRFITSAGKQVITPLNERVIGMSMEQLNNVPRLVALAGGKFKCQAIDASLRSGVINILITDKFTAHRLTS